MTKIRVADIPKFPWYRISETGVVYRKAYTDKRGYKKKERIVKVNFKAEYPQLEIHDESGRHTSSLHRLLALTFIPNPLGLPQVNHKDGDKFNYSLDNLEWCSASENVKHSYKHGLASNKGERHPRAKFSNEEVIVIRNMWDGGKLLKELAEIYDVHVTTIGKIVRGTHYQEDKGI